MILFAKVLMTKKVPYVYGIHSSALGPTRCEIQVYSAVDRDSFSPVEAACGEVIFLRGKIDFVLEA